MPEADKGTSNSLCFLHQQGNPFYCFVRVTFFIIPETGIHYLKRENAKWRSFVVNEVEEIEWMGQSGTEA